VQPCTQRSHTPCAHRTLSHTTHTTSQTQQIADKIGLPGLQLHEAVEDDAAEGTGTLIWTAGVRLSQHLVRNRAHELRGARVLDLGAGTGAWQCVVCVCVCVCVCVGCVEG
jgi:predicted nicotinamide N-methyase